MLHTLLSITIDYHRFEVYPYIDNQGMYTAFSCSFTLTSSHKVEQDQDVWKWTLERGEARKSGRRRNSSDLSSSLCTHLPFLWCISFTFPWILWWWSKKKNNNNIKLKKKIETLYHSPNTNKHLHTFDVFNHLHPVHWWNEMKRGTNTDSKTYSKTNEIGRIEQNSKTKEHLYPKCSWEDCRCSRR